MAHLNKKVSDDDFDADMTDVYVKYNGLGNSLVVTAGALKGCFSSGMSRKSSWRYRHAGGKRDRKGVVLKGGLYDADGKYAPWWSESEENAYVENYKTLKEELDEIKPFKNDTKLNGAGGVDSVVNELAGYKVAGVLLRHPKVWKRRSLKRRCEIVFDGNA